MIVDTRSCLTTILRHHGWGVGDGGGGERGGGEGRAFFLSTFDAITCVFSRPFHLQDHIALRTVLKEQSVTCP